MANLFDSCIALCFGVLLITICLPPTTDAASTSLRLKRSPDNTDYKPAKPPSICPNSTPCGWAVYSAYSRAVEYFMQNTCSCPSEQVCVRTEDDLSVSAFVYRCRDPKASSNSNS